MMKTIINSKKLFKNYFDQGGNFKLFDTGEKFIIRIMYMEESMMS